MERVIGIDGGGTKTELAVVRRDGTVEALFTADGCNPFDSDGWRLPLARLREEKAVREAAAQAIALGMPGYGEVATVSAAQEAEAARFGAGTLVINDVKAAYLGALGDRPGVLLLAGTGSMVWARTPRGEDLRVGGWGYGFGDEGSAYWIGHEAIARASRAIDGRLDAPGFVARLSATLGLTPDRPAEALIAWHRARRSPRADTAALARFVDEASAVEPLAAAILDEAAAHLALHVTTAWRSIGGEGPITWSMTGGAFNSERLRRRVTGLVGCPSLPPELPPLGGAVRYAARQAGWTTGHDWRQRFLETLAAHRR